MPEKLKGMKKISALAAKAAKQSRKTHDPVALTRKSLSGERSMLLKLEEEVQTEIEERISKVLDKQKEELQS